MSECTVKAFVMNNFLPTDSLVVAIVLILTLSFHLLVNMKAVWFLCRDLPIVNRGRHYLKEFNREAVREIMNRYPEWEHNEWEGERVRVVRMAKKIRGDVHYGITDEWKKGGLSILLHREDQPQKGTFWRVIAINRGEEFFVEKLISMMLNLDVIIPANIKYNELFDAIES